MIATLLALAAISANPEFVEPSDLMRRPELVGREVVVDDRVRYFLESKRGQGHDQLLLKRSDVLFRLPAKLKFGRAPSEPNARIMGTLKVEDGRWIVDVAAIEMLPNDLERFDRELGKLRAEDFPGKRTWALWAERRGKELNDPKLEAKGVALEGEALWLEAARPDADNLGLVARSAGRPIPQTVRNALAHRGFRDRYARASTAAEFEALARQIEAALPSSVDSKASSTDDSTALDAYKKDPAEAYRDAGGAVQVALDRRLLADTIQRSLERQLEASPTEANTLADVARDKLPDRPELADRLRKRALSESESRVTSMRQAELESLAKTFREQGEGDRAKRLIQAWLRDRRNKRLSASDAEGRVLLAASYDKLLSDRASAADLLREALAIEPQSKGAVDAFLRMGYRKGDAGWYDPDVAKSSPTDSPEGVAKPNRTRGSDDGTESLRGLTRAQVRSRLGGKARRSRPFGVAGPERRAVDLQERQGNPGGPLPVRAQLDRAPRNRILFRPEINPVRPVPKSPCSRTPIQSITNSPNGFVVIRLEPTRLCVCPRKKRELGKLSCPAVVLCWMRERKFATPCNGA